MSSKSISRRDFLEKVGKTAAGAAAVSLVGNKLFAMPHIKNTKIADKVLVLGLDGMDPNLLRQFVQRGTMPTFKKLMENGYFGQLATTMPAQSPVAWASFITGTNPGGNGIYDFVHRDPASFTPYLSTSRSYGASKTLDIGSWSIPLTGGKVDLLRRGPTFWKYLADHDIPSSVYKIPSNFPVQPSGTRAISGMGTPDLLGTYGTFTYFTDADVPGAENFSGGRVVKVTPENHMVRSSLEGPPNSLRTDGRPTKIDFTVCRDPREETVRIELQDHKLLMRKGEWSEWLPLKFELLPMFSSVAGMVRIYVQEVHPYFRLYMSPINVDPMDAEIPISNPSSYSEELSQAIGRFYTQGFPEDTKTLSNNVFSSEEFLSQSKIVLEERLKAFDYEINNFNEGFFFFYVSSIDQNSHVLYRCMHPEHPLYEPNASDDVKDALHFFYRSMDDMLRQTMSKMDSNSTLIVLSDHGFATFTREFNVSTWLVENGYTAVTDPDRYHESEFYDYVDWNKSKAFALGLNGIYINLYGREANGSVMPHEADKIKKEIVAKLSEVRDPATGKKMARGVYDTRQIYSGPYLDIAPDIVVGYDASYRISDESVLGKFPEKVFSDRVDKWSATHCIEPNVVPGVLLSNREVTSDKPGIWDLGPSILQKFGIEIPYEMDGKSILA